MRTFLEESFLNTYVNKRHELETLCTASDRVRIKLDANYENPDLNETINGHW